MAGTSDRSDEKLGLKGESSMLRQGDVLLVPVPSIPAAAKKVVGVSDLRFVRDFTDLSANPAI